VVQFDQIFFREGINIKVAHGRLFPRQRAHFCISRARFATLRFIHRVVVSFGAGEVVTHFEKLGLENQLHVMVQIDH
jgi:hypothetical protein